LLQAREHNPVAVIHHGPAMARNIARAGVMALLGRRRRGHHNKRDDEKKSDHAAAPHADRPARSNSAAALMSMRPKSASSLP
jgi:hypothetical protein